MSKGHSYNDGRYGVVTRHWFGLTPKLGGAAAAGFTFGSGDTGPDSTQVTRFYPKGPVDIIKFGRFALASMGHGASRVDRLITRLKGRGALASLMASLNIVQSGGGTVNPFAIASIDVTNTTDFPIKRVKAGEYISITTATKQTDKGTDLGATLTGTVAFFIDMVPAYDPTKWDRLI